MSKTRTEYSVRPVQHQVAQIGAGVWDPDNYHVSIDSNGPCRGDGSESITLRRDDAEISIHPAAWERLRATIDTCLLLIERRKQLLERDDLFPPEGQP